MDDAEKGSVCSMYFSSAEALLAIDISEIIGLMRKVETEEGTL